jgi:hypothetical protein
MAYNSGIAGRIAIGGSVIGGIKTWSLDQTTAEIPIPHFESPVDDLGRVWPEVLPGLSGGTGRLEGYFSSDAPATDSVITTGVYLQLALIFNKASSWGYGVTVLCTGFQTQAAVENQPESFTLQFRVTGIVPLSAVAA